MENKIAKNRNGFTLAELLVVVAIIGVLVAVAVPAFSSQMEKSREAVDLANIRSAYAEVCVDAITENEVTPRTVTLKQKKGKWQTGGAKEGLQSIGEVVGEPQEDGVCEVFWNPDESKVYFNFMGLKIEFPKWSEDNNGFAKAYYDLAAKYFDEGVLQQFGDTWSQTFNNHELINVYSHDKKGIGIIVPQMKAEKYDKDLVDIIYGPQVDRSTFSPINCFYVLDEENGKYIGLGYSYQGKYNGKNGKYLMHPDGTPFVDEETGEPRTDMAGDQYLKQWLADYYWNSDGSPKE